MAEKLYIFLTFAVCGIGGTQIYVRNKLNYLHNKGWKTCVISSEPGDEIIIKELEPYRNGIHKELANNPFLLSKHKRETIITEIIEFIKGFGSLTPDNVIIESSYIGISPWGEILAERLCAKHFIFFIQEDYRFKIDSYRKFFNFKFERGELAFNSKNAIETLFDGFKDIKDSEKYQLAPYCVNSIEDCESKILSSLPKADFYIGSFGRVNKPFVIPMIQDLVKYVKLHQDKTFHLVLFGWTDNNQDIIKIEQLLSETNNLTFQITGPIYPVPLCDLNKMDLFISTAGAARATSNEGLITISYDDVYLKPIGILDHTTQNSLYIEDETNVKLDNLMESILFEKKYYKQYKEPIDHEKLYNKRFDEHMRFVDQSNPDLTFYRTKLLKPHLKTKIAYFLKRVSKSFSTSYIRLE